MNIETVKGWFSTRRIYLIVSVLFVLWMIFFDGDHMLKQRELHSDIQELRKEKRFLNREIANTNKQLEEFQQPGALEQYARETYYLHKEEEDIFLIEYADSLSETPEGEEP